MPGAPSRIVHVSSIAHTDAKVTSEFVLEHHLEEQSEIKEQIETVKKIHIDFDTLRRQTKAALLLFRRMHPTLNAEIKTLKKKLSEEKAKLKEIKEKLILGADVVLGTLIGCGSQLEFLNKSRRQHFQLVIIDECGQSLEMACWVVIHLAPKLILAGDHHQLPPTVISKSVTGELSKSLMERVWEKNFSNVGAVMLQVIQNF